MKNNKFSIYSISILLLAGLFAGCDDTSVSTDDDSDEEVTISVDQANFLTAGLSESITVVSRTLSDGTTGDCYKIVAKGQPSDHSMGPWCPTNISDDASKGGIWLEGGKVYDVDGAFVKNMATFYNDATWKMYNTSTGVITKTSSLAECQAAANPNVGATYKNYCVECLPSYVSTLTQTYYIPVKPKKAASITSFGGGPQSSGPSQRGVAFNGVVFDAPAPVSNILGAYTLAPFDDAGGHINLNAGYHYHAANGLSKQIAQTDGHAAMIGYALDGYGMYQRLDPSGKEYTDLDAARGHYDTTRGYHYHVDNAGNNNFINGLRGVYAN